MSDDLTGLAMAPRRAGAGTATLVLLTLLLALAAYGARGAIVKLAEKDVTGVGRPVTGVVVDAKTGEVIRGARVRSENPGRVLMLPGAWSDEARTDGRGEFTVRASAEGREGELDASLIVATAPGYVRGEQSARFGEKLRIPLTRADPTAGD